MSYELFISRRYLRAARKQAFISLTTIISVGGVMLGVMALIVVIAVMTGAVSDLRDRILAITPHITVMGHPSGLSDQEGVRARIQKIPHVKATAPFVQTQVMIRGPSGGSGALLKGIDPALTNRMLDLSRMVHSGSLAALEAPKDDTGVRRPGIVLGKELARGIGAGLGDVVSVVSPKGTLSPIGLLPTMVNLEVVGILDSGMFEYDAALAWTGLEAAKKMLRMGSDVTGIEVMVDDVFAAGKVSDAISQELGFPFWARDWMRMNQNLFAALKLEKVAMFVILTLIVLVAAFNIASTLIMMVMEKKKDIAILKAMGATNTSIRKIFVVNGMIIGAMGTLFGVCLGTGLCELLARYKFIKLDSSVYPFTTLPVSIQPWDVLMIAGAALIICFLATLYPAWQASRLDPVESIRYG